MNYNKYDSYKNTDTSLFQFTSCGAVGDIEKVVHYTVTKREDIYNLAFGDLKYDFEKAEYFIDDEIVSGNGDIREVLATVAQTAYEFTETYPHIAVFFRGSDKRRTNTYKRAIQLNFIELSKEFDIFGARIDEDDNITDYPFDYKEAFDGFLIKRKQL